MKIAMATANFYQMPFHKALNIIKKAGFEYIELDGYWKGGDNWEAAQNLKNIKPVEIINMINDSGLKIASFHDMGGVIEHEHNSIVNPQTYEYLSLTEIPCVIFHTPHCKTNDINWWNRYKDNVINDLKPLTKNRIVCIENMVHFKNYYVPLLEPAKLLNFLNDKEIYATIDTTHYAQCGVDIVEAAKILKNKVQTIHLSDYSCRKPHVYINDGDLKFQAFYNQLNLSSLYLTTVECYIPCDDDNTAIKKSSETIDIIKRIIATK